MTEHEDDRNHPRRRAPRRGLRGVLLLLALLLVGAPALVRAEDDGGFARHLSRARTAFEQKDYDRAVREYRAAYHIRQAPGLLLNLGQAHRMMGNAADALGYYQMYLLKEPQPRADVVTELEAYIKQLDALSETAAARKKEIMSTLARLRGAPDDRSAPTATASVTPPAPPAGPGTTARPAPLGPTEAGYDPLAPKPKTADESRPVYKKWWFWTLIGGGVAVAAGVSLGVVYGRPAPGDYNPSFPGLAGLTVPLGR